MKIVLLIILLIPTIAHSQIYSTEEWVARYLSPCVKTRPNHVCFDKTKRSFKRMIRYKDMMFKYLDEYNLDRWLATIPFIESEYTEKVASKAGAVGLWQIMPWNLQYYQTKRWNGINFHYTRKPKRNYAVKQGHNPKVNTEIACKMLKHLYEKYGREEHETVVRAYNAGETRIDRALKGIGKPLTDETLNYYQQLLALQILLDDIVGDNVYKLR